MLSTPTATDAPRPAPADQLANRLPRDWLLGQEIGVLAYALAQAADLSSEDGRRSHRQRADRLISKLGQYKRRHARHAATLPAATLRVLSRPELLARMPRRLRGDLEPWRQYDEVARGRWDLIGQAFRPSQLNAAKIITHQILHSDANARGIIDALAVFLSDRFADLHKDAVHEEQLALAVGTLREGWRTTAELVQAAVQLTRLLSRYSGSGFLVRNALLDELLAWPVLVYDDPLAGSETAVGATSLPVAVELTFDGADAVMFRSDNLRGAGEDVSLTGWMGHLRRSADVGKALWRAKNGNKGTWRDKVLSASVTYDFTIAEAIMRRAGLTPIFADRSMEAYFAQIVLAKAIGRRCGLTAAVSGMIGEQREVHPRAPVRPSAAPAPTLETARADSGDEPEMPAVREEERILDWRMKWPGAVRQKKEYVYTSYKYDRFILPALFEVFDTDSGEHEAYVETNHCHHLSDVADCVQPGGWRQFRYVRGADAAHAVHRRPEELPPLETPEVTRCLGVLAASREAVVRLPPEIRPAHLFSALYHINFIRRLATEPCPPSLSWSAVRTVPEETDARFWHLLLRRVLGCRQEDFDALRLAETPEEVAGLVAQALGSLAPDVERRAEMAPDLLIVLGGRRLETPLDEDLLGAMVPQSFPAVIEALREAHIPPVSDPRVREWLGSTRMIVVAEDQPVGAPAPAGLVVSRDEAERLARLGAFRFGFTQQMASIALHHVEPNPVRLRAWLRQKVEAGVFAYAGGWYTVRAGLEMPERSERQQAYDHFYAGMAHAPYLMSRSIPGLNLSEALLLDHVREAAWHFERAAAAANVHRSIRAQAGTGADEMVRIRDLGRLAQQRIERFFDTPIWRQVWQLSRRRAGMPHRAAYEIGEDLLQFFADHGRSPKPADLGVVASAAGQWWLDLRRDPSAQPAAVDSLFARTCELFEIAHARAGQAPQFHREQLLNVSTWYAAFLRLHGRTEELRARLLQLDKEILLALADGVQGYAISGEWFEQYGDAIESEADAAAIYLLGMRGAPRYYNNWVKHMGAALLSGEAKADLRTRFRELPPPERARLVEWIPSAGSISRTKRGWARHRWNVGSGFLVGNFATRPNPGAPARSPAPAG